MKYKNIFNYILSVICFISWSNLAMGQEKPKPVAPATKTVAQCDLQKIVSESESLKTEHTEKLKSFDPKSKTVKNKIIGDGVSTNIFLVKLLAAQAGCKNTSDKEKQWLNSEIEKNTKQLKIYTNSYCKAAPMPGDSNQSKNSVETVELGPDKDGGCKSNAERRIVNFIFNTCTPGSADYDLKLCECHIKDRGNSCLTEKDTVQKLVQKIEATAEDKICDEKTPQSKSSFFDSKNFWDLLAIGALLGFAGFLAYKGYKNIKNTKAKNAETLAANGGATTAGGGAKNTNPGKSGTLAARISGTVNPPSPAEQIAMRDRNRANGDGDGGGEYGGIYMQGAFELKTDAQGVVIESNVIIHGTPGFTVVGRVGNNGSTSILNIKESGIHDVGTLEIIVKNNNSVTGKMRHGGGKEWIYGDVVGSYSNK